MNFVNPKFFATVCGDYFSDIDRIKRFNFEQIEKYRDKVFRELIKYAYTVPLYNKKFKEKGVHPDDIKGIRDIVKLPVINRKDVIDSYPDGIIPPGSKKAILVNTSGSTRNPVSLYVDQRTLMKALIAYVRELRQYGIRWNKSRISIIANFYSQTAPTQYFASGTTPVLGFVKPFISLKNIQHINADDDLIDITRRVNEFNPECILGFPGPIRHIALLKSKGYGENINPKCIISSGCLIGSYQKKFIEDIIGARVFDVYGATEAGPIAFECENGNYHINSDFVYLETIDKDGNTIPKGKNGRLAMTRLYGRGTPLIRYTGMGDIIQLAEGMCDCGRETELLGKVNGRIKECLVLPDNKIVYPDALNEVPDMVLFDLKTDKIDRLQVVQESLDKIEILVIINKEKRDIGPSVDELFKSLKAEYQKLVGKQVEVTIKEVTKLKSDGSDEESTPGILTKIDADKYIA